MLLVLWMIFGRNDVGFVYWMGGVIVSMGYLGFLVWPYSVFGKKMIQKVPYDSQQGIHLIVGNVYQYNRSYEKILQLIKKNDPDLVFLVETDQAWVDALTPVHDIYRHRILLPLDNTYGLALYSKLPLKRQEIKYLISKEIPSLEIDVELRNGKPVTIYAIHPTPPVPGESLNSTERDAEILIVGKKSKENPRPSLVIGDLNDVAWSYTTSLFLKISEMADPRRGRGFYSTFHAKYPFFRWPLDHVFLSKHFGLSKIHVLKPIGSDHFPIELKAVLNSYESTDTETASAEEKKEANEKIRNGHKEAE
ncbi:Endonuclease/Exonuclease/phosphatase family protein [Algoriphagus boritolerans DSM 17298 = JCM 18970]|uniref:Endonuclease/Exonuclease/phosphatase family protein n=2 Tax=Algoriphagus TaxID=246875 RepID=A0A1H5RPK6_9BACT|nr:Endonuclease/Exonuclease/phosphatase family protein [Algoriphagus boritolerans DSM 17298 = JCM 18970]